MSETFNPNNEDRSNDFGYPALYLKETKSSGGYGIKASQNMPYEIITPSIQNVTVSGTNITAQIRTTTGKSLSGNEIPYIDNGFESITINEPNFLDTPRIIASKVNEDNKVSNNIGNKTFNMRVFLNTTDSRISPVIDAQRVSAILTSNRINAPITNYATDPRVNDIQADPSSFQYISKEILLENPASSIKVLVSAHINTYCDIRAFYSVSDEEGFNPIFIPFPGYSNLNSRGQIISAENNDGSSDIFVPKVNSYSFGSEFAEFDEYTFTADRLPSFRSYRIKLVLTSTSQVYVPIIKNLRVLALA
jgi:hypothetical protein